ncbi:hypothetical protein LK994_07620 [Ferruginibacter lapsinanis]|uniref:hypothetical protein n=1 Tax=Ferruginibacter lapsinanis TaxID=563172 RepID=UPI001E4B262C|nr:hypothetical protein [Ferruginibacter lapsinanis]UEG48502.1 hypothetical protein LK994_07620 [Ferruginibacter lapsinanis]
MKKTTFLVIGFFLLLQTETFSQALRQPLSASYLGLGAYSTQHQDVFSYLGNQASLAKIETAGVGVYGERRFMLNETSLYAASVAIPSKMGNFGVNMKYFGFKNYNENQLGLAYARSLGSKVDVGVQFNYYGYKVPSYNSASTVDFEIGLITHLTDKLNAGIHVYNPIGGKFSKTDEKLTAAYKLGMGYDASDKFFVGAEIVKEEDFPVNVNAGIQYRFMKQLFARAGISSATSASYAGVGLAWNNFRLDVSGSYHPQLGWSPGLLLIMNFGKKEKITNNDIK